MTNGFTLNIIPVSNILYTNDQQESFIYITFNYLDKNHVLGFEQEGVLENHQLND